SSSFDTSKPRASAQPPPLPEEAEVPQKGYTFELIGLKPLDAIADAGRAISGAGDAVNKFVGGAIHQFEETPDLQQQARMGVEDAALGWAKQHLGEDSLVTRGLATATSLGREVDRQARHFEGGV